MGSKESEHPSPGLALASPLDRLHEDDQPEVPGTPDRVKFSNDTTTYTNSGHWTSILDGVSLDVLVDSHPYSLATFLHKYNLPVQGENDLLHCCLRKHATLWTIADFDG
jgi:hypothetical protein